MKKILFLAVVAMNLFIMACQKPMSDIYDEFDAQKVPYNAVTSYTIATADYTTFSSLVSKYYANDKVNAGNIKTFSAFSPNREIYNYPLAVADFLKQKYPAYNLNSSIALTYNYMTNRGMIASASLSAYADANDYSSMSAIYNDGDVIKNQGYVTDADMPTLYKYIKSNIMATSEAKVLKLKFKYLATAPGTSQTVTKFFIYDGSNWSLLAFPFTASSAYELQSTDYTAIGGNVATNNFIADADLPLLSAYMKSTIFPAALIGDYFLITYKKDGSTYVDAYFTYNGTNWVIDTKKAYTWTNADYAYFGTSSNTPGQYNNFSSSTATFQTCADYWFKNYYNTTPLGFPATGESKAIIYKYFISSSKSTTNNKPSVTEIRISDFTFNGASWNEIVAKTATFSYQADGWKFDPTIRVSMLVGDYQMIVNYVRDHATWNGYYNQQYKNEESWFGANAYYSEFNFQTTSRTGTYTYNSVVYNRDPNNEYTGKTYEQLTPLFNQRVQEGIKVLLEIKYPKVEPLVNNVQVYAIVNYLAYNGSGYPLSVKYKCTSTGKFELVPGTYTSISVIK